MQHFAQVNSNSNFEAGPPVRPSGTLLDADGATDCVSSRGERREHSVAEPLDLLASTERKRFADQVVMGLEDIRAGLISRSLQVNSRVDEIGVEEGDNA